MAFEQRLKQAKAFEMDVEAFCRHKFVAVAKNGTEHTHPDFVDLLRRRSDSGSKLVRFAPDGVALQVGGLWHWEAKASQNIERDAYETYMAYHDMGAKLLVFVRSPQTGQVYWQRIERIGFIPSELVVVRYRPERRHPIDEDDWICPRQGHGFAGTGSGTPYKEIDFDSLISIPDFYQIIETQAGAA